MSFNISKNLPDWCVLQATNHKPRQTNIGHAYFPTGHVRKQRKKPKKKNQTKEGNVGTIFFDALIDPKNGSFSLNTDRIKIKLDHILD